MEIIFGFGLIALVGAGVFAFLRLQSLVLRMTRIEEEIAFICLRWDREHAAESEPPHKTEMPLPVIERELPRDTVPPARAMLETRERPEGKPRTLKEQWSAFEIIAGTKWLNWAGIVLVTIGVLFFLKFAYDNQWIGPRGRIAIGAILGAGALIAGDRFRRRGYPILFQSLTGGGLAAFYGCVYFSFQVYQLTGQRLSFFMLILVTALAVAMSVVHDARLICLFGQLGGFLSPVLISTGENRPIELFIFVIILNLATMACAYFKNWRDINLVAFVGTWLLYAGWAGKFYNPSQLEVAFFFSVIFYLIFLVVPTLRAAARREPLAAQDLHLIVLNTVIEFFNNNILLSERYRAWLGLAVVLQAVTLAAMYAYWSRRCAEDSKSRLTLLLGSLALVIVAVPIQLRFYAIPIGWSLEALLFGFIGLQYRRWAFQLAAIIAIALAAVALLLQLPLHTTLFTPIFNRPFGSWAAVSALAFGLYAIFRRFKDGIDQSLKRAAGFPLGLAVVLLCALVHMEIFTFWDVQRQISDPQIARSYQFTSVLFLWSAIPLVFLLLGRYRFLPSSFVAALAGYGVGFVLLVSAAATGAWIPSEIPFLNLQWLSRFLFVVSLWVGAKQMRSIGDRPENWEHWTILLPIVEGAGHAILGFLLYAEVDAWLSVSKTFSPFMRYGFVSALWSLQALLLIGIGLRTQSGFRRVFGFVLFGLTVAKLLTVDMAVLQPVYRIVSFAVTGVLLIVAAFLYQKFARALLESGKLPPRNAGERAA